MISHRVVNGHKQTATASLLNASYSGARVGSDWCDEFIDNLKLADGSGWSKSDNVVDSYRSVPSDDNHTVTGIGDYTLTLKNINATGFAKIITVSLKDCNADNLLTKLDAYLKSVTKPVGGESYDHNNFIIVNAIINIR
jgi:hypothetical protein